MPRVLWLLVGLSLLFGGASRAALPPRPTTYVLDDAHILSPQVVAALDTRLEDFERESSDQILVATFPALPADYALEDFTQRTAEAWGVGQKAKNNGAVLFIFPQDRKMRIEVGYGLEAVLPDGLAGQIIQNEIRPAFARGDFNAGVTAGVDAMIKATRGEYHGTGRTQADARETENSSSVLILILVVVFIIITVLSQKGGGGGTTFGGRGGSILPFGGFGGFGGGGGSSGGGGGGGGFSGGGGSFGGGGASGGW